MCGCVRARARGHITFTNKSIAFLFDVFFANKSIAFLLDFFLKIKVLYFYLMFFRLRRP